jgi:hypothetical protein
MPTVGSPLAPHPKPLGAKDSAAAGSGVVRLLPPPSLPGVLTEVAIELSLSLQQLSVVTVSMLKDTIAAKLGSAPVGIACGDIDVLAMDGSLSLAAIGVRVGNPFVVLTE